MSTERDPLAHADLRGRVDKALREFLAGQQADLARIAGDLDELAEMATTFVVEGGKRLRPAFCYWGWRAAGADDAEPVVAAAAALELVHACALVHDDVMDRSDTRRGRPSMHRRFAQLHREAGRRGDPEAFGRAAAILLGDLCLIWADVMVEHAGVGDAALQRARPVYDDMRVELMCGQYLDLAEQSAPTVDLARALRVSHYKSAKYTVERPLHFGARLAGGDDGLCDALSAYGLPLGEAFQLRDDVLGVFGDPSTTGKPAGDDLREGKHTALVAIASRRAGGAGAAVLAGSLGSPELDEVGVVRLQEVIRDTGALADVELMIASRTAHALEALSAIPIPAEARNALSDLAHAATARLL